MLKMRYVAGVPGVKPVLIELTDFKTKEKVDELEVDAVMVATGRAPFTQVIFTSIHLLYQRMPSCCFSLNQTCSGQACLPLLSYMTMLPLPSCCTRITTGSHVGGSCCFLQGDVHRVVIAYSETKGQCPDVEERVRNSICNSDDRFIVIRTESYSCFH